MKVEVRPVARDTVAELAYRSQQFLLLAADRTRSALPPTASQGVGMLSETAMSPSPTPTRHSPSEESASKERASMEGMSYVAANPPMVDGMLMVESSRRSLRWRSSRRLGRERIGGEYRFEEESQGGRIVRRSKQAFE